MFGLSSCLVGLLTSAVIFADYNGDHIQPLHLTGELPTRIILAQAPASKTTNDPKIREIQEFLVWTGYYEGPLDGDAGQGTVKAIKLFQQNLGAPETGSLEQTQQATLTRKANEVSQRVGFTTVKESATGITMGIPSGMASRQASVQAGTNFRSPDGKMLIGLRSFKTDQDFKVFYQKTKDAIKSTTPLYTVFHDNWFVLGGGNELKRFYIRYHQKDNVVAGFFAVYDKDFPEDIRASLTAAITMMSLTFQPFAGPTSHPFDPKIIELVAVEPATLMQPSATTPNSLPSATGRSTQSDGSPIANQVKVSEQKSSAVSSPKETTEEEYKRKITKLEAANATLVEQEAAQKSQRSWIISLVVLAAILGLIAVYFGSRLRLASRTGLATSAMQATANQSGLPLANSVAAAGGSEFQTQAWRNVLAIGGLVGVAALVALAVSLISMAVGI